MPYLLSAVTRLYAGVPLFFLTQSFRFGLGNGIIFLILNDIGRVSPIPPIVTIVTELSQFS